MVVRGGVVDGSNRWVVGYRQSSKQLPEPQSSIFIDSAIDVQIGAWPAVTTPVKQKVLRNTINRTRSTRFHRSGVKYHTPKRPTRLPVSWTALIFLFAAFA
ncbi:hypothetical protein L1887_36233 [Cichorium endivia]|nr:hypothetical protein L1887_36233 [Cichorium endivia]